MIKNRLVGYSKAKRIVYLIIAFISTGICVLGITLNEKQKYQQKIAYAKATVKNETKTIEQLNKRIKRLYQDEQEEFLKVPLEKNLLDNIERDISALKISAADFDLKNKDFAVDTSKMLSKKKVLLNKIQEVNLKEAIQNQISDLLIQKPKDWAKDSGNSVINEHVNTKKIQEIRDQLPENEKAWKKAMTDFLNEMALQVTQYNKLKEFINAMLDGEKLSHTASSEQFHSSYGQLSQIKNTSLKKELVDKLDLIGELLEVQPAMEADVLSASDDINEQANGEAEME